MVGIMRPENPVIETVRLVTVRTAPPACVCSALGSAQAIKKVSVAPGQSTLLLLMCGAEHVNSAFERAGAEWDHI